MELTFNGFQLIVRIRRRQVKSRRENAAPITRRTPPDHRARFQHLYARGGTHILPAR